MSSHPELHKPYCVAKSPLFVIYDSSFLQARSEAENLHFDVFVSCKLTQFFFLPLWFRRLFWPNPGKMNLCICGFDRQNGSSRPLSVVRRSRSVWFHDAASNPILTKYLGRFRLWDGE